MYGATAGIERRLIVTVLNWNTCSISYAWHSRATQYRWHAPIWFAASLHPPKLQATPLEKS